MLTVVLSGILSVTTACGQIKTLFPMVISPKTLAPAQIVTSFKMVGCRLMFCEDFTFLLPNTTSLNKLYGGNMKDLKNSNIGETEILYKGNEIIEERKLDD